MYLTLSLLIAAAGPETGGGCAVTGAEADAQSALSYAAFDGRTGATGWRQLNARGCTDAAVALLERYRAANGSRLTAAERREIAFHIGQALAFAGRDGEALGAFRQADGTDADAEWRAFVAGTIAFLGRDPAGLAAARAAYAAAPGADPMRLRVLDGFIACPRRSYMEAAHCAMPGRTEGDGS